MKKTIFGFQKNVFFLGWVSFFNDVSSDMVMRLIPLYLTNVLGAKPVIVGLVEGVAETTATILKYFSGWLSDKLSRRKPMIVFGYTLSSFTRPLFAFAGNWGWVLLFRFSDRVGKGIRTAPRDALIADSTESHERGKAFGWQRALDPLGATVGLLISAVFVFSIQGNKNLLNVTAFKWLAIFSFIPALVAVSLLLFFVKENHKSSTQIPPTPPFLKGGQEEEKTKKRNNGGIVKRKRAFVFFLFILVIFNLGNSSDAFLVLRMQNSGMNVFHILLLLAVFNMATALCAYPAGLLSDRLGRKKLILMGWIVYACVYFGFASARSTFELALLFLYYGLFYGFTEGVEKALVADLVPDSSSRGKAFGLYHFSVGAALLPASLAAGYLWQNVNPGAPFLFGGVLALLASILLWFGLPEKKLAQMSTKE